MASPSEQGAPVIPMMQCKMAASVPDEEFIAVNFDLLSNNDELNPDNILLAVSAEDVQQVENIVQEAIQQETEQNTKDSDDFETAPKISRHVKKTDAQIDEYASEEHARNTKFQTAWAVNVFKGNSIISH